ncbi:MAG: methyltransferase [Candidatus Dormiibacterota bacterium]
MIGGPRSERSTDLSRIWGELNSERELVALAITLGATEVGGPLSAKERRLISGTAAPMPSRTAVREAMDAIHAGFDPLGEAFCVLRSGARRRQDGAIYTPPKIVTPMVDWALSESPLRIVDAGSGSGRFSAEIARRNPHVEIVAVDLDPLAALMTRAALAVLGHHRARVLQADYTQVKLPSARGITAFIGNPPYVRHHQLGARAKARASDAARAAGHSISGLAGLHAHFYLATVLLARSGDVGCFVTSSEWLDVNYGQVVRNLFVNGLGGVSLHVLGSDVMPFEATTTAAVTCFRVGQSSKKVRLQSVKNVEELTSLSGGKPTPVGTLAATKRWTTLFRPQPKVPSGFVELGEICRVHRGAVTGANATWIASQGGNGLPARVLFPAVTRAKELFEAGASLANAEKLRQVIDIPADLDELDSQERKAVLRFLREAARRGADRGYIASHRRAWWAVGLSEPAPILATYMARRPPAFVLNTVDARHINIAHGLYPRAPLPRRSLERLARSLRSSVRVGQGRTYAGGLTKFEPREMERLPVPSLEVLLEP